MRKQLMIFTVSCALSSYSYALTLDEALINTYQHNQTLQAQREVLKKTDEHATLALSKFLPSLNLQSQSTNSKTKYENALRVTTSGNVTANSIQLNQNVFNGGQDLVNIKKADAVIKAGRAKLQGTEQEVLLSAIKAYVSVVQSKEIMNINQQNVATLKKHLQSVEERFEQGEVTRTDVAASKSSLAEAKTALIGAEGDYKSTLASFEKVVGLPATDIKQPAELKNIPLSFDEALKLALLNNPQIIVANFNNAVLEKNVTTTKMALLPNATLQGTITKTVGPDNIPTLQPGDYRNKALTLNVIVPLFQTGAEYSNVRAAKSELRKGKFDLKEAVEKTKEDTIKSWQGLETATASISSSIEAVEAAKIALEGTTQEAEVGTKTNLEVIDAELKLFRSKLALVQAQSQKIYNLYMVKAAIGDLSASSLQLATTIYDPTANYRKVRFKFVGF